MKTVLRLLIVATLSIFFINTGFAQTAVKKGSGNATAGAVVQCKFVDEDKNGTCDNHEAKAKGVQCANFADKDGNGTNDNCPKNSSGDKNASCQGHQQRHDCGQGNANCCGQGSGQGKGQGNCCPNKRGNSGVAPSVSPEPK